jgi:UrcA family protein
MDTNPSANSLHRQICIAAFVALAASLPAVSHASGPLDDRTVTLDYAAASASTPLGAGSLYQRIHGAAQDICSVLDHGDLSSKRISRACVQMVVENAVKGVNRQALTAVYESNYPPIPMPQFLAAQQR